MSVIQIRVRSNGAQALGYRNHDDHAADLPGNITTIVSRSAQTNESNYPPSIPIRFLASGSTAVKRHPMTSTHIALRDPMEESATRHCPRKLCLWRSANTHRVWMFLEYPYRPSIRIFIMSYHLLLKSSQSLSRVMIQPTGLTACTAYLT